MMLCFALLVHASLLMVDADVASAEVPFQFGAPNTRAPDDPHVNGVRFSILHGKNESIRGLDIGLLSLSETSKLSGVSLVLGIGKVNDGMSSGAAISLVNIHGGNDSGLNAAFINLVNDAENAVDFGFVNIADGETLLDIGGLNISKSSTAQLGFINVTKEIKGFQFGFVNIAENGFLKVFPVFNFPKPEQKPKN
jgi:hypothetical protein